MPLYTASNIVRFGTFELNLRNGELRKRGLSIALQEQPQRVLIALLERPGEVVSREDLCRRLWPHGTHVDFEHSLNAAVRRLRMTLGDTAELPRFVETVHKRGYRFVAINTVLGATLPATANPHLVRKRARLAVLPFAPVGGFTDGLTEEAITQLTQACPGSVGVIARTSVVRAQRDGGGAAEIGRALGAKYLVEGYVRSDGDRVRITAQLIEAQEETHLWAQTFDRVVTDALAVQSEVAEEIAKAVTDALSNAKRASA